MFRLIESLQKKPESTRRHIAFGVSLIVVLIIGSVWFSTLPSRTSLERRERASEGNSTTVGPFESAKNSLSRLFEGFTFDEQIAAPLEIGENGTSSSLFDSTSTKEN